MRQQHPCGEKPMNRKHLICTGTLSTLMTFGCFDPGPNEDTAVSDSTGGMDTDEPPSNETSSGPDDDSTGESTGGPQVDVDPPYIVSISPSDGAVGVRAKAPIVVTFSEPMNEAATEAAYHSTDIPPDDVTMSWNDAGDELTIIPKEPLALADGVDLEMVEAIAYSLTIGTQAQDLAGNALEEDHTIEFWTARLILAPFAAMQDQSGTIAADGFVTDLSMSVGDGGDQASAHYKGFMSFDIGGLPKDIIELVAEMHLHQEGVYGFPYEELGDMIAYDVEYSSMDASTFQDPPIAEVGVLSDNPDVETKVLEVTSFVWDDYQAERDTTQFRMEFPTVNNLDNKEDFAVFASHPDSDIIPRLLVLYLVP
jgi:hypothetical protein